MPHSRPDAKPAPLPSSWGAAWLAQLRLMPARCLALISRLDEKPDARIHALRRATKLWRGLLRLAPPQLEAQARLIRREVGVIRRSFGAARNAQVIAVTLARFSSLSAIHPTPVRKAPRAAHGADLGRQKLTALRLRLMAIEKRQSQWKRADVDDAHLAKALVRGFRKARRLAKPKLRTAPLARIHALRTAVVDLASQCAFFGARGVKPLAQLARDAETLRGLLGRIVDLDMAAGKARGDVADQLAHAMRKARRKAARAARRLFDTRPRQLRKRLARLLAA